MAIKAVQLITASQGWMLDHNKDTASCARGRNEESSSYLIHGCKKGDKVVINMWATKSGGWDRKESHDPYNDPDNYITTFTTESYSAFTNEWHRKSDVSDEPSKAIFDALVQNATPESSQKRNNNPFGW